MSFVKRLTRVARAGVKDVFRRVDERKRAIEDWVEDQEERGQHSDPATPYATRAQEADVDQAVDERAAAAARELDDIEAGLDGESASDEAIADDSAPELTRKRMGPQ